MGMRAFKPTSAGRRFYTVADFNEITRDTPERSLVEPGDKEVQSTAIGEQVMEGLRELDQVAYVRFASVYRSFRDIHEFMAELSHLLQQGKGEK